MMNENQLFNETKWEVELDVFEGPLDLLLHLIRTLEIDIYDIPIAEVTDQYLEYIQTMQNLQLDVASDYLVMAATLMQIKSEMLVPRNESQSSELDEMDVEGEDPRQHLIETLLEYKRYKEVSQKLHEKEKKRSDFHTKLPTDVSEYQQNIPLAKSDVGPIDLFETMKKLIDAHELTTPSQTTIQTDEMTVFDQIEWITEAIHRTDQKQVDFSDLLKSNTKSEIVVTFLAVLELMKKNKVKVKQKSAQEEIKIVLSEK